jgi:hypothetical protein
MLVTGPRNFVVEEGPDTNKNFGRILIEGAGQQLIPLPWIQAIDKIVQRRIVQLHCFLAIEVPKS